MRTGNNYSGARWAFSMQKRGKQERTYIPYGEPGHVCTRCDTVDCKSHDDRRCPVCGGFETVGSHVRCM